MVYHVYVEKKPQFAQEAASAAADLRLGLQLESIKNVRIINRYYAEGIDENDFEAARNTIFSEPPVDLTYDTLPSFDNARCFAVEYLPGQFDQRADSCAQCISLATGKERPVIQSAKIYAVYGNINDEDFIRIKSWLINPVESREASLEKPETLYRKYDEPKDIAILEGFISLSDTKLEELLKEMNLAMDIADLKFCRTYFRDEEKRNPTLTELRVIDTYWSDHCRHTTFLTELDNIQIEDEIISKSYNNYLKLRETLALSGKPVTLMDMATIGAKALKQKGLLDDLDESEEINACSVKIKVDVKSFCGNEGTEEQDWLLMFKNETHNHPTEIEPFGGAATCLGGAIRDPLSGRAFVYQAMRITGAADPLQDTSLVISGKLPQRKICRTAAAGYSSYGNQIGLATGLVNEIYHPDYAAKRMEIGAVIAAAPAANVVRQKPEQGDVVILLGGRTGRDGIGGATGSSKSHTTDSIEKNGAEVQKGNAPEERKLQRLFRNPEATRLIKKCNDFGAGGVSVSVGELADGLSIDLDKVPKKYEGLDGSELAISESQERMSVVVAKKDAAAFISLAAHENLEATVIAEVTEQKRLVMKWRDKTILNLSRDFLNSNGVKKTANVRIIKTHSPINKFSALNKEELEKFAGSLNVCCQKGLVGFFDSSVGAATVIAPFGGKYQMTPAQVMAAKIPVLNGDTQTVSLMSWGFDPEISSASPYHGAVFSVVYSVAKIIAAGGSRKKCRLTFQEYFEKLRDDPLRWGKPAAALLGALDAQLGLETAAIGGKDSMSGSFTCKDGTEINVPPTLVSFAVSVTNIGRIVTPEFKKAGSFVYLFTHRDAETTDEYFFELRKLFDETEKLIAQVKVLSCWAVGSGGTAEAIVKMCFGNRIGFNSQTELAAGLGFGGFVIETDELLENVELIGYTTSDYTIKTPSFKITLEELQNIREKTLEPVYPYLKQVISDQGLGIRNKELFSEQTSANSISRIPGNQSQILKNQSLFCTKRTKNKKPLFLIPVFPGTNSEYDTARAIVKAGGNAQIFVIRNLTPIDIAESVCGFEKSLRSAQALVIPGGFSGGDEPDGSGKFITAFIRNSAITDAVMELLQKRDGLICGICNGFQALIKLGLVPCGEIRDMTEDSPTLTFNSIGRHQSVLVRTKVVSNKSPWLSVFETGESYIVPVSHGEGRFTAGQPLVRKLAANGQIATQYVDFEGNPSQDIRFNPNNSDYAIEGITSQDGRIFGRMAHNERVEEGLYRNIPDIKKMDIFSGAVRYFS